MISTYIIGSGTSLVLTSLDSDRLRFKPDAVYRGYPYYSYSGSEQDGYVIECITFGEYGTGRTFEDAMKDLKSSIVDYYFMLKRHQKAIEKEYAPYAVGSISHDWQIMKDYLEEVKETRSTPSAKCQE